MPLPASGLPSPDTSAFAEATVSRRPGNSTRPACRTFGRRAPISALTTTAVEDFGSLAEPPCRLVSGSGQPSTPPVRQRYFALGNIDLVHEIGRTWSASVGYSRNMDFSSLFLEPMLSDNVFADFGGLISSRLSFQSSVGYTTSAVGFGGGENRYDTAHGLVGLQTGLTRYVALGVNYTYYYRTIGQALEVPSGLATHAESQAVHVFVSAWAPLFQRIEETEWYPVRSTRRTTYC